jgi:hypothetical protein
LAVQPLSALITAKKELPSGEFFERDEGKSFIPRKVFPQKNSIFNF